jgi:hypothetical protein
MPLFGRRRGVDAAPPAATNGTTNGTTGGGFMSRFGGRSYGSYPEALNSRPTFGQWIKGTWLDILTMAALGAIGLGVSNPSNLNYHKTKRKHHSLTQNRSTTPTRRPAARSPSPSRTARLSIPTSPIPCVMRLCPFGPPQCWHSSFRRLSF